MKPSRITRNTLRLISKAYELWRWFRSYKFVLFEEASAKRFEAAKYGALRVDQEGNSVLVALYDQNLKIIKQ